MNSKIENIPAQKQNSDALRTTDWYGDKAKSKNTKHKDDRHRRAAVVRWLALWVLVIAADTVVIVLHLTRPHDDRAYFMWSQGIAAPAFWQSQLEWIIVIELYVTIGLLLATLWAWHKLRSRPLIVTYLAGGSILTVLIIVLGIPGSLGFFYNGCLPPGVNLTDVVDPKGATTVQQALAGLGGHCDTNGLVDLGGKPIYLYKLDICLGTLSPVKSRTEIFQQQQDEIARLKEQYTVIEVPFCSI